MNTQSKNNNSARRKEDHIRICTDPQQYTIEHVSNGFDELSFIHNALPDIDTEHIDCSCAFLGYHLRLPLLISAMTGGGERGENINRQVVDIASQSGIGVALGSMRALFRDKTLRAHFALKSIAQHVPLIGNLGLTQLREFTSADIIDLCAELQFDALSIHLNCGQELCQAHGDRDFSGLLDMLGELCARYSKPIIVKETGFGIAPREIARLRTIGVRHIDIAGAGGTNWISVEAYRQHNNKSVDMKLFSTWGIPTAHNLLALRYCPDVRDDIMIIASGGIRTAADIAKSIMLGADAAAAALPFIRHIVAGGVDKALAYIRELTDGLKYIMALNGALTIDELRRQPLLTSPAVEHAARQLAATAGA